LNNIGNSKSYIRKVRNIIRGHSGSDPQSILKAVPAVEVILNQLTMLNNNIEDLRDTISMTPKKCFFEEPLLTGIDPERIHAGRAHEIIAGNNATLVNQVKH
jgi:hypothetical protein